MSRSITYTALPNVPLVEPGDDLCAIVKAGLAASNIIPESGDVIVIAQKIVSKAEDRYVELAGIAPSPRAQELSQVTGKDARLLEVVLSELVRSAAREAERDYCRASPGIRDG